MASATAHLLSPYAGTKLYCLVTEARMCEQLAQGCTRQRGGWVSNLRPADRKSCTLHHGAR